MSARSRMTGRAFLYRDVPLGATPVGLPEAERRLVNDSLPCRIWTASASEVTDGKFTTVSADRARVPLNSDVRKDDVLSISGREYRVETVIQRGGHQMLALQGRASK